MVFGVFVCFTKNNNGGSYILSIIVTKSGDYDAGGIVCGRYGGFKVRGEVVEG